MPDPLQVVIGPAPEGIRIAGLPAVLRAAQRVADVVAPERIVLLGRDPDFARRWKRQLAGLGSSHAACVDGLAAEEFLAPGIPVLAVDGSGLFKKGALERFLRQARANEPARWMLRGKLLAAYHPSPASYASGPASAGREYEAQADEWLAFQEPTELRRAEQAFFDGLIQDTDGYIARFDRRLSVALSRLMLRTPIAPNHITTLSLLLGLLGASGLAVGSYPGQVASALLLWFCCILDGCDGEVARLKLLCSRRGADYDRSADHITHLAIFLAIPFAVRHMNPHARVLLPGALLVSGLAACMFSVWWLILRRPTPWHSPAQLVCERIASRDYVYLILVLVVIKRLYWFLWAAALGAHLFNLLLWRLSLRNQEAAPAEPAS